MHLRKLYLSEELSPTWVSLVWQSSPYPPPPWSPRRPPAPSPPSCAECDSARSPCSYWSAQRAVPPPRPRAEEPWLELLLWAAWRGSVGQSYPGRPPGSCAGPGGSCPAGGCCCLPRRFPDSARRECSAWVSRCPKQHMLSPLPVSSESS
jgi:hypothetical protein